MTSDGRAAIRDELGAWSDPRLVTSRPGGRAGVSRRDDMFDTLGENEKGTPERRGMRVIWIVVVVAIVVLVAFAFL